MYVIYALVDPTTNKVHYVGMAKDIYRRFVEHLSYAGDNWKKNEWIDGLRVQGMLPICKTLEIVHTLEIARSREQYWIHHFAYLKEPLTNAQCRSELVPSRLPFAKMKPAIVGSVEERLSMAHQQLSVESKLTLNALAQLAHVRKTTASKWLAEQNGKESNQ